jgi:hypothetical protein
VPTHYDKLPAGAEILGEYALEMEDDLGPDEELQALVKRAVQEAISWRQENLDPEQAKATDYYKGRPFGDEVEGRSKVVSTEVRDVVKAILPSLLRVFFGPERVVEFAPRKEHNAPLSEQQTDYVNHIIREDNEGFLAFHAAFKDALVRKLGILTWWWDDTPVEEAASYSGLTQEEVDMLMMEEGVTLDLVETQEAVIDPNTGEVIEPALFDCEYVRVLEAGRARIAAVPSEEFVFSPNARSREDARMMGRIRDVPAHELIDMGFDPELVKRSKGSSKRADSGDEVADARAFDGGARRMFEDEQDSASRPVQFADLYMYVGVGDEDEDGDSGRAELRHIQAIGENFEIVTNDRVDEKPFALFCPDPEPHTMIGMSAADYVMDLQRISSAVLRGMLDSLALSLNPATEVVEGEINMRDLLNNEIGRVVRARRPGMMREVATSFVGREALPVLQWLGEIKENRTGISKAAAGLDADALQSSTKAAVAATLSGAQQQIEMIARVFAETGMKTLFSGLLKLTVRHQDKARTIKLRGEYVTVDPRHWETDLHVVVNVALGAGLTEEKLNTLSLILDKQEQNIQQGSPLVGLHHYRATLARMVELMGFPNSSEFFKQFGAEENEQYEQAQAEAAGEPDAQTKALVEVEMAKIQASQAEAQAKAQIEAVKAQAQAQVKEMEMRVRMQEAQLHDAREREKMAMEFALAQAKLEADHGIKLSEAQLKAARLQLDRERAEVDAVRTGADLAIRTDTEGSSE